MALMEAMGLSLPSVVLWDEAFASVAQDQINCCVAHDIQSFVQQCVRLINSPELCQSLSQQARQTFQKYQQRHTVDAYYRVYQDAINQVSP